MVKTILTGHISPETSYVVADYPYGFRLRCQIRYWLEYKRNQGVRLVSQTSNPKCAGLVWNKPKASTYAKFGGCMFLNEENHVCWSGLTEYTDYAQADGWRTTYDAGNHECAKDLTAAWIDAKRRYELSKLSPTLVALIKG